ncbi:major facilitator superfamily domain-containing protein [Glomus cerebriforme]|uniref:Major facilitator superfamily domain-containing protein n=1 Tax=Glomus cerebriforme TaxID=658196 RepID=A0A397T6W8_9GLOM|nr:major facilitator superfamily domain-containing protein [Glomus cerebriforme]
MSSEKTATPDTISSDSNTTTNTNTNNDSNNAKVEKKTDDLEAQTTISNDYDNAGPGNGQPVVQLGKIELLLVMLGLAFGVFLAALDQTIVATALPAIASDFKALDKIAWVATAYLLTTTAFQPTYGKFSDIFGRKATFLFAITMFELGSLLCGLAPNMTTMIVFRAIAGIGGGGIISLVMIIISDIVSLQDRGKYQGMIGGVYGISSVVGPLLGGAFTDHVTWRWAFYINLPLGAITIGAVIFLLHIPRPKGSLLQKLKRIDYAGTIAVVGSTVVLLIPLNWGGNEYEWSSPIIIVLLIVGCIGYILFAVIETKFAIEPVAPPHLFKRLHVVGCFSTNFFQGMAFFSLVYYVPLYFQVVRGDSATASGLELIPYILGVVIASIFTGQAVSRTDKLSYRTICAMGAALIAIGVGLITLWDANTGRGPQIGYMIIAGLGVGAIMQTTLLCGQGIVEYKDVAAVTALLMFFRLIGAVFGVAIVGTIFSNVLSTNLEKIAISPEIIEAVKQSATIVNQISDVTTRNAIIDAYVNALRAAFTADIPISILCFICSIFMGNHKPNLSRSETIVAFE